MIRVEYQLLVTVDTARGQWTSEPIQVYSDGIGGAMVEARRQVEALAATMKDEQ